MKALDQRCLDDAQFAGGTLKVKTLPEIKAQWANKIKFMLTHCFWTGHNYQNTAPADYYPKGDYPDKCTKCGERRVWKV